MTDLFAHPAAADFEARAISPVRELGAYEALWLRDGATFKSIADLFRAQPGAVPSDFVGARLNDHAGASVSARAISRRVALCRSEAAASD
jgi:hypothetical protein